jgi:meiotically up-regulated gene 157 (Mug157) protein
MWLRDSTAQVWPYLPLINDDAGLKLLIRGLINRQVACVLLDPYANAFYKDESRISHWNDDKPPLKPGVHERKWEVDSLCYVIRLAHKYWKLTGDTSLFDREWQQPMKLILQTFKTEQRLYGESPYYFIRKTSAMIDAPVFGGTGRPILPTGMICSMFRPSDDATMYPFLVPSNLFAQQELLHLRDIFDKGLDQPDFANQCNSLANEIGEGIKKYAIVEHLDFGNIYAYELDGFGNRVFMDDANVPSLMSLAYLGIHQPGDEIYENMRSFLLSDYNPYFLKGKAAEGQASPHTGKKNIWPMGIILRAMTSTDDAEILKCLKMLKSTHAGTGFMHESFNKDDAADYTRSWFAWANTLFGEMIIKVYDERRELLGRMIE